MRLRYAIAFLFLLLPSVALAQATPGTSARMAYNHSYTSSGVTFANLGTACGGGSKAPTPPNCAPQISGSLVWCKDCTNTTACAGSGSGAWAILNAGSTWGCNVNGVNQASVSGSLTNLTAGPGAISVTGNSHNGTDQISGISVNGMLNANTFAGADEGAKINNAITSLGSQGGAIYVPAGTYSFSTTIQCPISSNIPVDIWGAGRSSDAISTISTTLKYTGNGDAINQVITSGAQQNDTGCKLHHIGVDGAGAGAAAIGFHVGGTTYSNLENVVISSFGGAGIELENANGMFTERYEWDQLTLWRNKVGAYFHCDASCNPSFSHGYMNVFMNTEPSQTSLSLDGGGVMSNGFYILNGNIEGVGTGGVLWNVTGNSIVNNAFVVAATECNTSTGCTRFQVANGSTFAITLINDITAAPGAWTDANSSASFFLQGFSTGSVLSTAGNIFAGTNSPPADASLGDIWTIRGANTGELLFGSSSPQTIDYGLSTAGNFTSSANVIVPSLSDQCSGTVNLSGGTGSATNACIVAGRPIVCTDQTAAAAVACVNNGGSITVTGTGSDHITWVRL